MALSEILTGQSPHVVAGADARRAAVSSGLAPPCDCGYSEAGGAAHPAGAGHQARACLRRKTASGGPPKTIHALDQHYDNLQRELRRTFRTLDLAA